MEECILYNSNSWDGEVRIQRGGLEFGDVSDRCFEDEQFVGSKDGE